MASKGNKGNRIGSVLSNLEETWKTYCKNITLNIEQDSYIIYAIVSKLQQLISSQERYCKVLLSNHRDDGITLMYEILQYFSKVDHVICCTLLEAFLAVATTAKRILTLNETGIICILTESLVRSTNAFINSVEPSQLEDFFFSMHTLLAKVGSKDKRLVTLSRLNGAVSSSVIVLKTFGGNLRIVFPVLQVMKIYSNSAANCNILVKGGVVSTLIKLLPLCGQKKLQLLKLCLELLSALCKSKTGAKKAVSAGLIPMLLAMFQDWHRSDHRNRQLNLRKLILVVIKACVMFGFGKKSFETNDGYRMLYFFGLEAIDRKECENLLRVLTFILRKCTKDNNVPVKSQQSVYSFLLPNSNQSLPMSEDLYSKTEDSENENSQVNSEESNSSEDELSFVDGMENLKLKSSTESMDTTSKCSTQLVGLDVGSYKQFLQELSLKHDSDEDDAEGQEDSRTIRIPVASMDSSAEGVENMILTELDEADRSDTLMIQESSEMFEGLRNSKLLDEYCETSVDCPSKITSISAQNKTQFEEISGVNVCNNVLTHKTLTTQCRLCELGNHNQNSWDGCNKCMNQCRSQFSNSDHDSLPMSNRSSSSCTSEKSTSLDESHIYKYLLMSENSVDNCLLEAENSIYNCPRGSDHLTKDNCSDKTDNMNDHDCSLEKMMKIEGPMQSHSKHVFPLKDQVSINELNNKSKHPMNVEHVLDFVKIADPMTYGHFPTQEMEPLLPKKQNLQRLMLFQDLSRHVFPERVTKKVVYDLDELTEKSFSTIPPIPLPTAKPSAHSRATTPVRKSQSAPKMSTSRSNNSISTLKEEILRTQPLSFESRFECGNLRKAVQIRHYEYDLVLNSDTNSSSHHQWFYFQVENMLPDTEYRFNIINCEKTNSQFNYGMQPVFYSVQEATNGNPGWERLGTNVCYYRNCFSRGPTSTKTYFTTTFSLTFPHKNDTCYLAYHYPYTYTMLKAYLLQLETRLSSSIFYKRQVLCETLGGNDVDVITITSSSRQNETQKKRYVILTARVHPGESNSSWIMKGILNFLLSDDLLAKQLCTVFVFKIVPMLNPDGVINGNHRCSLTGEDLNRQWKYPDATLHPSIYQVKSLIQALIKIDKAPFMFVDFHGHSRKKNVFMYGCQENISVSNGNSNCQMKTSFCESTTGLSYGLYPSENKVKQFPRVLSSVSPYFSLQSCNYTMEKSKEATARIVGYQELGIEQSYTLESTYCGMDQGNHSGYHMGTRQLEEMGRDFCKALFKLVMCPTANISDFP